MGRLIDEQTAYNVLTDYYHHTLGIQHAALKEALGRVETVDAVPTGVYKQVRWERDIAMQQLDTLGYGLGEKVVPVVRCKDCRYWNDAPAADGYNSCEMDALIRYEGFFCANGERKDDDGNG